MILTLKKIEHKGAERTGICFSYSSVHNRIQSPLDRLNLTTEDKNEKKNDKKV